MTDPHLFEQGTFRSPDAPIEPMPTLADLEALRAQLLPLNRVEPWRLRLTPTPIPLSTADPFSHIGLTRRFRAGAFTPYLRITHAADEPAPVRGRRRHTLSPSRSRRKRQAAACAQRTAR